VIEAKYLVFRFGDVELREREFSLTKPGEVLALEPKAYQVLLYLLRNPQKLVTKEELLNAVWGDAIVTDNSLTRIIAVLRRVLDDDFREPRYIATVARVGYRFLCPVEVSGEVPEVHEPAEEDTGSVVDGVAGADTSARDPEEATKGREEGAGSRSRMPLWALAGTGLLAVGMLSDLNRPLPMPRVSAYTRITQDGDEKALTGTDGVRLYFWQNASRTIAEVAISGGATRRIPIDLPNAADHLTGLVEVSNDGANFLVYSSETGNPDAVFWKVPILGGTAVRVGEGVSAGFSPDGKSVAYSKRDGEIDLARSDGVGAHKLAWVGGAAYGLTWSPDGSHIRFSINDRFWEISSNGSNLHAVAPGFHASSWQCCGRWTRDGKYFAFLSTGPNGQGNEIWALDERRGLFRHPSPTPVQLTSGATFWDIPVSDRDGKTLFSQGGTFRGQLSRLNAHKKEFEPFLGGISALGVTFSKDLHSIAYVAYPGGILWKANADGSNPVQLTEPTMDVILPRWSPDATQILFINLSTPNDGMHVVPSQGGVARKLLPEDKNQESDPSWSPDGRKIAFSSRGADSKGEIRILDLDSRQVTTLPGSQGLGSSNWSPDGRYIAALASSHPNLTVFDTKTQRWSVLSHEFVVGLPEWSSDSRTVYFVLWPETGERGIYRAQVTGGKAEQVVNLKDWHWAGWWDYWMGLDPTDTPLLLRDTGTNDLYALTLEEK
jgi:DNA-binding winged helix-turn-helix (wHTH) protein/Tol biopolymer transport system component